MFDLNKTFDTISEYYQCMILLQFLFQLRTF
jgi:hypothetical protein